MHFCAPPESVKKYQMRKFLQNHFNNLNCFFFLLIQKGIIKSCATLRIAVTNLEILKLKEVFHIGSDRFLACDHQNRFSWKRLIILFNSLRLILCFCWLGEIDIRSVSLLTLIYFIKVRMKGTLYIGALTAVIIKSPR